jgi:SAM-dependent methyltransferase
MKFRRQASSCKQPDRHSKAEAATVEKELPLPPEEMRALVGGLGPEHFDNPRRVLVYDHLPTHVYESVFDFGCGCGRLARRLIQQNPQPRRYLGIDLHRGMIKWCQANLTPFAPAFQFEHHDVFNAGLNPRSTARVLPFPADSASFSLAEAWSVFTHLSPDQSEHYLRETARVLTPDGVLQSTWFLFDKSDFPMMQDFQDALFINEIDPSNAVIYDREWLRRTVRSAGLVIYSITAPKVRGFQWQLLMAPIESGLKEAAFPPDDAPRGIRNPPCLPAQAERIGLEEITPDSEADPMRPAS